MKKSVRVLCLLIIPILLLSFVSAGFFSNVWGKITGGAVVEGSNLVENPNFVGADGWTTNYGGQYGRITKDALTDPDGTTFGRITVLTPSYPDCWATGPLPSHCNSFLQNIEANVYAGRSYKARAKFRTNSNTKAGLMLIARDDPYANPVESTKIMIGNGDWQTIETQAVEFTGSHELLDLRLYVAEPDGQNTSVDWTDVKVFEVSESLCEDSDGGIEPYISGILTEPDGGMLRDYCLDSNTLLEAYCLDQADAQGNLRGSENIYCDNGCSNGKCNDIPPAPAPVSNKTDSCDVRITLDDDDDAYTFNGVNIEVKSFDRYDDEVTLKVDDIYFKMEEGDWIDEYGVALEVMGIYAQTVPVEKISVELCLNRTSVLNTTACTDSDGGEDIFKKGTTTGRKWVDDDEIISRTDACGYMSGIHEELIQCSGDNCGVDEYSCRVMNWAPNDYFVNGNMYPCPADCYDGACVCDERVVLGDNEYLHMYNGVEINLRVIDPHYDEVTINLDGVLYDIEVGDTIDEGGIKITPIEIMHQTVPYDQYHAELCLNPSKTQQCIPRYYCITKPTICPSSGIQIKTCEDAECNEPGYTEEVSCNPGECAGCQFEDSCIPYGFRTEVDIYHDQVGSYKLYCDIDGELEMQKVKDPNTGAWATCQNSYECESNLCSSGQCVELLDLTEDVNAFKRVGVRFICKLSNLFSNQGYNECLYEFLGPEQTTEETYESSSPPMAPVPTA